MVDGTSAQAQRGTTAGLALAGPHRRLLGTRQDGPGVFQKRRPRLGQPHPARQAHQQRHAHFLFQLLELGGQRRLGDEQLLGRAGDAAQLGGGDEVLQVSQFHRSSRGFPIFYEYAFYMK